MWCRRQATLAGYHRQRRPLTTGIAVASAHSRPSAVTDVFMDSILDTRHFVDYLCGVTIQN